MVKHWNMKCNDVLVLVFCFSLCFTVLYSISPNSLTVIFFLFVFYLFPFFLFYSAPSLLSLIFDCYLYLILRTSYFYLFIDFYTIPSFLIEWVFISISKLRAFFLIQSLLDIVQSQIKGERVSFSPIGTEADCFTHTILKVMSNNKAGRGGA